MERSSQKALLASSGAFQSTVLIIIVVGAFFMGSLWTKVQILEKGGLVAQAPSAAAPAPDAGNAAPQAAAKAPKIDKNDHIRGDANAPIVLVEYSDYECPFCKTFHPTAQKIVDEYKGKVAWVYRHFPLSFHANAQKQAEASECVAELGGNDAFWKFTDAIYERTTSNGTGFALDKLGPLAAELGVNQAKFQDCLDSGKYEKKVKDQMAQGSAEGVTGTPGNILLDTKSGKTSVIPGAVPFEQVKAAIDAML